MLSWYARNSKLPNSGFQTNSKNFGDSPSFHLRLYGALHLDFVCSIIEFFDRASTYSTAALSHCATLLYHFLFYSLCHNLQPFRSSIVQLFNFLVFVFPNSTWSWAIMWGINTWPTLLNELTLNQRWMSFCSCRPNLHNRTSSIHIFECKTIRFPLNGPLDHPSASNVTFIGHFPPPPVRSSVRRPLGKFQLLACSESSYRLPDSTTWVSIRTYKFELAEVVWTPEWRV